MSPARAPAKPNPSRHVRMTETGLTGSGRAGRRVQCAFEQTQDGEELVMRTEKELLHQSSTDLELSKHDYSLLLFRAVKLVELGSVSRPLLYFALLKQWLVFLICKESNHGLCTRAT